MRSPRDHHDSLGRTPAEVCKAVRKFDEDYLSGGLKSFGHPFGASGVRMIYEVVTHLRGEAGSRQLLDAGLGLVHDMGGPDSVACVVGLGRP